MMFKDVPVGDIFRQDVENDGEHYFMKVTRDRKVYVINLGTAFLCAGDAFTPEEEVELMMGGEVFQTYLRQQSSRTGGNV